MSTKAERCRTQKGTAKSNRILELGLDSLGRVVIPKFYREALGLIDRDKIHVIPYPDGLFFYNADSQNCNFDSRNIAGPIIESPLELRLFELFSNAPFTTKKLFVDLLETINATESMPAL